jgi:SAM-dependent methyltransferase
MYRQMADWWPLISHPDDYADEAAFIHQTLEAHITGELHTLLELGSGGGNNASYLKAFYRLTLVDLSADMLAVSRRLNPECEHLQGNMLTVDLGRIFDAVMVHDAIMYLTRQDELLQMLRNAWAHCREGGVVILLPDCVKESFTPETKQHGRDDGKRALRYLEWTYDPDESDTTFITDFAYLLRHPDGSAQVFHDRHVMGLFPRRTWIEVIRQAGFAPRWIVDHWSRDVFLGIKKSPDLAG